MDKNNNHGQKVSKRVHRTNYQVNILNNSDGKRGVDQTCQTTEAQRFLLDREDRAGRDTTSSNRGTVAGGILKQFIQETNDQLIESITRTEKLRDRIEQLISLFNELSAKTGETWDDLLELQKSSENLGKEE